MHRALLLAACLLLPSCKKESPSGLPPSNDWQAGSASGAPPAGGGGAMGGGGANPHGNMGGGADPHAGVPGAPPIGGGGTGGTMGGGDPSQPVKTAPKMLEKTADGRSVLGPFTLEVPKEWTEKPVTSSMRAAQFVLSDKSGEQAELVVFYFGEGGAGGVDANLERWLGQVSQPDGKPSKDVAKIEKLKIAGQDATIVSVAGRLTTTQMPGGPPPVDMPDAMLLGGIVGSPSGPYYFKLTGAKKTIEAHAAKFRTMLTSMKLK